MQGWLDGQSEIALSHVHAFTMSILPAQLQLVRTDLYSFLCCLLSYNGDSSEANEGTKALSVSLFIAKNV